LLMRVLNLFKDLSLASQCLLMMRLSLLIDAM
jgi:hypothetical protein